MPGVACWTARAALGVAALMTLAAEAGQATGPRPTVPSAVPAKLPDAAEPAPLAAVSLLAGGPQGSLAGRVAANAARRLAQVDPGPLLAGFRKRPGSHPWIGEHVGKWLHAATLAWVNTGDGKLRARLDEVARELIKTQEADGYLGTYVPGERFGLFRGADWDVWVHKYNLIGLLTYYRYTGDAASLAACRKMGDLLDRTFGPGKKSLLSAGTHVGMAATSVLEPMVLLYRHTGEHRYLDFARDIVRCWDEPKGPRVLHTLTTEKSVSRTANGKAYEMLSNLVGLCELARATGDRGYLEPCLNAWQDVVNRHLYLTGSASSHELFQEDAALPNGQSASVGETCVTVTWIQLNAQLLRLTGEARFGDELERSYYNHLAGAQRPDGAEWCYYTSLEGAKPYGPGINCCVSSGPRGMALAPEQALLVHRDTAGDTLIVNLYETLTATLHLGGKSTSVDMCSLLPATGDVTLMVECPEAAEFAVRLRLPGWMETPRIRVANAAEAAAVAERGWLTVPRRKWSGRTPVRLTCRLSPRAIPGVRGNAGKTALAWGPLVLAYDSSANPGLPPPGALGLAYPAGGPPFTAERRPDGSVRFSGRVRSGADPGGRDAVFVPFSEAGAGGGRYRVWLPSPGAALPRSESLFAFAAESRSRSGNVDGAIADGDPGTYVVTFNARPAAEDWYAVVRETPAEFRRVSFRHGHSFHDGGWFDASAGKPRVEIRRTPDGPWEKIGELTSYPATTATDSRGLKDGQEFLLQLDASVRAVGLRVTGKPASGDNPAQAFSSCAELQATP